MRALLALALVAGCLATDASTGHVRVWLEDDHAPGGEAWRVEVNGRTATFTMPRSDGPPHVRVAFEGDVTGDALRVRVEHLPSGASVEETFPLETENHVVVERYRDGTLEAWRTDGAPLFD